jgi:hypothetical protein
MAEKNTEGTDLVYVIGVLTAAIAVAIPIALVMAVRVSPRSFERLTWRHAFKMAAAAALVAIACGAVFLLKPGFSQEVLWSLGRARLRAHHVIAWLGTNFALLTVTIGTIPYWRRFVTEQKQDLRKTLY